VRSAIIGFPWFPTIAVPCSSLISFIRFNGLHWCKFYAKLFFFLGLFLLGT
jgi:hypothetical protein